MKLANLSLNILVKMVLLSYPNIIHIIERPYLLRSENPIPVGAAKVNAKNQPFWLVFSLFFACFCHKNWFVSLLRSAGS